MQNDNGRETVFAEERQAQIIKLLKKDHKVLVPQLCEAYGVSAATIRNDLNDLEKRGLLKRTHGGAIMMVKTSYEENVEEKLTKNNDLKSVIAKEAAKLVEDGDTIAIDTGTTMLAFARSLIDKNNLTVITNDMSIAMFMDSNLRNSSVILMGGLVRKKHNCTLGRMTLACLEGLCVDKSFIATNGLTAEFGLSTPHMSQADVKRKMAQMAHEVIVLCDSEKIGTDVFVQVLPIEDVNILITDKGADKNQLNKIEQSGVKIIIA